MVAGLTRLVTCLQSNLIGPNLRGLFSSPFVSYWAHIDWLAPGYLMGAGNPTISGETKTQVQASCQPRQPHKKPYQPTLTIVKQGKELQQTSHQRACKQEWSEIFKVLKERKNTHTLEFYINRIIFKKWRTKTFSDNWKLRGFTNRYVKSIFLR